MCCQHSIKARISSDDIFEVYIIDIIPNHLVIVLLCITYRITYIRILHEESKKKNTIYKNTL